MTSRWRYHCIFLNFFYITCQRQPAALKLCKLIVYLKFYKICRFENHVTRNDAIMMSLPKNNRNNRKMRTSAEPYYIYIRFRSDLLKKCNYYWIWATVSSVMGIYVSVNSNWVHPPPGNPSGLAQKHCPGGRDLTFDSCPGAGNFDKGGDFVEIQSETFCPCIGFISNKYRVSQNC